MQPAHTRGIPLVLVLFIALVTAGCGGGDPAAASDDRDAQELYDAAFTEPPTDLSIINIPETARRPTVSATYPGSDVPAATEEIHDALVDAGWTIVTDSADQDRGHIVGERGDDDIQVELTRGDPFSSVSLTFAAPGEGL